MPATYLGGVTSRYSSGPFTSRRTSVATWAYSAVVSSLLVPEQDLDHADIHLLLQQMGGKAVAQGVHRHPLVDLGRSRRGMYRTVELAGAQRVDRVLSRKQPAAWK